MAITRAQQVRQMLREGTDPRIVPEEFALAPILAETEDTDDAGLDMSPFLYDDFQQRARPGFNLPFVKELGLAGLSRIFSKPISVAGNVLSRLGSFRPSRSSKLGLFGRSNTLADFFQAMRDQKAREDAAARGLEKQRGQAMQAMRSDQAYGGGDRQGGFGPGSGGFSEADPTASEGSFAEGGRIGAQEGGIMPRLNQLGSGVSSAEQTLQDINQRLESAESSLGEGGVEQLQAVQPGSNNLFFGRPILELQGQPMKIDPPSFTRPGNIPGTNVPYSTLRGGDQVERLLPSNQFSQVTPPQTPVAMQTPLSGVPAAGYADGGDVRQGYFLGKIVKKAKRAVKKVAKSPIGKAAILGGLTFGLNKAFPGTFLKGGKLTGLGKLGLGALISSAPLLFQEEEDEGQQLASMGSVGGQIDPRAYTDPRSVLFSAFKMADGGPMDEKMNELLKAFETYKKMGGTLSYEEFSKIFATENFAEGGDVEPVAKKTMPLLDMGGQEMDLRAEGGFVPIGRMEKADDVPARLSKNEFVFTADAVRNAGDGDVDKGAEVMYNMMKNLESGGDVSEESQGLKGARKMFQTSQRLEEVL